MVFSRHGVDFLNERCTQFYGSRFGSRIQSLIDTADWMKYVGTYGKKKRRKHKSSGR